MPRSTALFIGLRYIRAKHNNHFISFISFISMLGIALGVVVLITVLSVINGFDQEIKKRVLSMIPSITVNSMTNQMSNWQALEHKLQHVQQVTATAPVVLGQALLKNDDSTQYAVVTGILPEKEKNIIALPEKIIKGSFFNLTSGQHGMLLGEELAHRLNVTVGDTVTVVTPQGSSLSQNVTPRFTHFTITGIFRAQGRFGFDAKLAFINLHDAQTLFQIGSSVTALHVNVKDVYAAPLVAEQLINQLSPTLIVTNWTNQFGEFFNSIRLTKTIMFFIFLLIITVGVFNLICTLVMAVKNKQADIAILRTLGATPTTIMAIFIVQGAVVGMIGTLFGIIGGIGLAAHVTEIVNLIQTIFHVKFISSNIYFVDYLPSQIQWSDVWQISIVALVLSLLATLYPAWKASQLEPAETLRFE